MASAVDCSEEESVCTESERNEDWDEGSHQMDYGQEDPDEQPFSQQEAFEGASNRKMLEVIQSVRLEKGKLEEILKNQVDNIVELQCACEKMASTLEQLPLVREQSMERFNEVISNIQSLRTKQCNLCDRIEQIVQIYDSSMAAVHSVKQRFAGERKLNKERRLVIESGLPSLSETAVDTIVNTIEARVVQKKEYCSTLNRYLAELNQSEESIRQLNEMIDSTFGAANEHNRELLELDSNLKASIETKELLEERLLSGSSAFEKRINELSENELKVSGEIAVLRQRLEDSGNKLETAVCGNAELKDRLSSYVEQLTDLDNENSRLAAEVRSLSQSKADIDAQELSLLEILSDLRCRKEIVSLMQSEVQTTEAELNAKKNRVAELEDACAQMNKGIEENEREMRTTLERINCTNQELEKLQQEISSAQETNEQEKQKIESRELATTNDIGQMQDVINEMKLQLHLYCVEFEQYRGKFEELQSRKASRRSEISEKHGEVSEKQVYMNSITEMLEEHEVEWSRCNEEKRAASERIDHVRKLNDELSEGRKELAQLNETFSKLLENLNKNNTDKIKEIIADMENKKTENLVALAELVDQTSRLEVEQSKLKATENSYDLLWKDAVKQSEIYACEQGLLSTFGNWVFEEEGGEPSVTSTSNYQPDQDSPTNEVEDFDFEVKDIKTAKKATSYHEEATS